MFRIEEKTGAALPTAGPISKLVEELLAGPQDELAGSTVGELAISLCEEVEDPLGDDDLQLALYLCFELHYRSFSGVDPAWEWERSLLAIRAALERRFLAALEAELGPAEPARPSEVGEALFRIEAADDGVSLSRHLETVAGLEEFREFVVHRSLYS